MQNYKFGILLLHVIHFSIYSIDRLMSVTLQINVRATYQMNGMVILQIFKKLMLKAMYNSHQHLHSRRTKGDYEEQNKKIQNIL